MTRWTEVVTGVHGGAAVAKGRSEGMVVGCSEGEEGDGDKGGGVLEMGVKAGVGGRGRDLGVVIVGAGDWGC